MLNRISVDISLEAVTGVAYQCLSEIATAHEIHVLLHLNDVVSTEFVQRCRHLGGKVRRYHRRKFRLAEKLQAVDRKLLCELVEINRLIVLF